MNCNARMGPRQIKQHRKLSDESQALIRVAMTELNLSARAYDRILKVSRTIADLAASDAIIARHVSEAIQNQLSIRPLWSNEGSLHIGLRDNHQTAVMATTGFFEA